MNVIDLEKYKNAWKNEPGFTEAKLDRADIKKYIHSVSKDINSQFRTGIIIDIVLKVILALSFAGVIIIFSKVYTIVLMAAVLIGIIASIVCYQLKIHKIIPDYKEGKNIISLLKDNIGFYYNSFIKSLLVAALTGPLIFISGSLYYFYFRYGGLRTLYVGDYIVFAVFITASFILGAFSQVWNFKYRIQQMETNLAEIEQDTIDEISIEEYKRKRRKTMIIMSIGLLIGVFLMIFLIFNLNN